MENYETYLIVFLAGMTIGVLMGVSVGVGALRRTQWEYPAVGVREPYRAAPPDRHAQFWLSLLIGTMLLGAAFLFLRQDGERAVPGPDISIPISGVR